MFSVTEVEMYIETKILHSGPYDNSNDKQKVKANNQAWDTLCDFIVEDRLTLKDLAEQVVFLFKLDSTIQRADLGVNFVTVDGVQMTIQNKERTLAPSIMRRHNINSTRNRRVGGYSLNLRDTFRYGNGD